MPLDFLADAVPALLRRAADFLAARKDRSLGDSARRLRRCKPAAAEPGAPRDTTEPPLPVAAALRLFLRSPDPAEDWRAAREARLLAVAAVVVLGVVLGVVTPSKGWSRAFCAPRVPPLFAPGPERGSVVLWLRSRSPSMDCRAMREVRLPEVAAAVLFGDGVTARGCGDPIEVRPPLRRLAGLPTTGAASCGGVAGSFGEVSGAFRAPT